MPRRARQRVPLRIRTTTEKLVFGGQALAHYEGKPVFLWNALPGEEVEAIITTRKRSHWEGVVDTIMTPADFRITPEETHYLSSSPWGIMPLASELQYKHDIAIETYQYIGKISFSNDLQITSREEIYGYRNKIEFSFYEFDQHDTRGQGISLAFFQRGQKYKVPISASALAEPVINDVAQYILEWVQQQSLGRRQLKSLIVRSNGQGQAIAALFIKEQMSFDSYPELTKQLIGFHIFYSHYQSPASVPDELLYTAGQLDLDYTINDVQLRFGLLGFFQVNVPIFIEALNDIRSHIPDNAGLLDFYCGVGAIGLVLAKQCRSVELVDNNLEAIEYAQANISLNSLQACRAQCVAAENITDLIESHHTIIVDPPRAGLHPDVVRRLLQVLPKTIIYLSCNIATQARDIQLLSEKYSISFVKIYNFFPRTPHIEGLCVLTLTF